MDNEASETDRIDWKALLQLARQRVRQKLPEIGQDLQDDLAQECITQLFLYEADHEVDNLGGLLTRIAAARCTDYIRRRKYPSLDIDELHEVLADDPPLQPEATAAALELATVTIYEVFRAQESSKPGRKNAGVPCSKLVLAIRSDLSWNDLGDELGVAPNTLSQKWKRCRAGFMKLVEAQGVKPQFLQLAEQALYGGD